MVNSNFFLIQELKKNEYLKEIGKKSIKHSIEPFLERQF